MSIIVGWASRAAGIVLRLSLTLIINTQDPNDLVQQPLSILFLSLLDIDPITPLTYCI